MPNISTVFALRPLYYHSRETSSSEWFRTYFDCFSPLAAEGDVITSSENHSAVCSVYMHFAAMLIHW